MKSNNKACLEYLTDIQKWAVEPEVTRAEAARRVGVSRHVLKTFLDKNEIKWHGLQSRLEGEIEYIQRAAADPRQTMTEVKKNLNISDVTLTSFLAKHNIEWINLIKSFEPYHEEITCWAKGKTTLVQAAERLSTYLNTPVSDENVLCYCKRHGVKWASTKYANLNDKELKKLKTLASSRTVSLEQAAKAMNVSQVTLSKSLLYYKIQWQAKQNSSQNFNESLEARQIRVHRMSADGITAKDISVSVGVSLATVYNYLKKPVPHNTLAV